MSTIFKSFPMEVKANSANNLVFKISTRVPDRDEDVLEPKGAKMENYRANPCVLFAHNYADLPVGRSVKETVYPDYIESEVEFAPTAFAQDCKRLCEGGFLNAASVGFIGLKSESIEGSQWGRHYTEWELLEWSIVPVPSNAASLMARAKSAGLNLDAMEKELNQLQTKKVIPYKKYPLADEGESWDGPAEITAAEVDDLKQMCAWVDEKNAENKGAYKLPHHTQADKNTVWRGVRAAMSALVSGARGGVDIPEDDRKGVYEHLAKHYADFDKEAPEFKDYTDIEIKEMFPEEIEAKEVPSDELKEVFLELQVDTKEIFVIDENAKRISKVNLTGLEHKMFDGILEEKSGATLSAKNRETLQAIHDDMNGCHDTMKKCGGRLKEFIEGTMPMIPDDEPMMSAQMTMPMMGPDGMPMMSAMRTVEISEIKQALDELKSQVSILLEKTEKQTDAPKGNLDAIKKGSRVIRFKAPPAAKDAANKKPKVKLDGNLVNRLMESFDKKLEQKIKGGI